MARTLYDLLNPDPRSQAASRGDVQLTEEQSRLLIEGAIPIFAERSLRLRGAVPYAVRNDPGAMKTRKLKLVDLADPTVGPDGTGGTFDHLGQAFDDQVVMRVHKNWELPRLELLAMRRSGNYEPLKALGGRIADRIVEFENKFIVNGAGGTKGITNVSGSQTFAAGAAWTTAGQAWKDLVKAVDDKLRNQKIPVEKASMLCNPTDYANLKQVFSATSQVQIEYLDDLLPGGVYPTVEVTAGTAFVYANTPVVMEAQVMEDLTSINLPMVDESPRGRLRLSESFHITKPLGVVSVTGI